MLDWHSQFSRFEPTSELSVLNRDPRESVPVSAMMTRFVQAAVQMASLTGGLVDPTLVREVERAGYAGDYAGVPVPLSDVLRLAPDPRPAAPHPAGRWRQISVDRRRGVVDRPVGVRLDSGGIAKGLFGDVLAWVLGRHESFAIEAAGDVVLGGAAGRERPVRIADPFRAGEIRHTFLLTHGAVATSGMSQRSWLGPDGRPAHHLLDPATGRPAFTGIIQATALAPSGVEAEARAKAALLSGPQAAPEWLPHGGLLLYPDGSHELVEASS
jgi:thiamine biosynthesis lipoprotein